MKKIYWGLIIAGIIGSLISIYFAGDHPAVMVGFFAIYLLVSIALFTHYFGTLKINQGIPILIPKEN
jgi:hypothetical protein